ncbi:hypothetical protein HK098_006159 [Nowakowskiella sp. JEL0407]|nr:hypothetical protein HK098_006159 [Nowakowskiella sp. JEL0407]
MQKPTPSTINEFSWITHIASLSKAECGQILIPPYQHLGMAEQERISFGFIPEPHLKKCLPLNYIPDNQPFRLPFNPISTAKLAVNAPCNRYADVVPYNYNRVKLIQRPSSVGTDYINASYVGGFESCSRYIATQGPLETTIVDFYNMIIEQNSRLVVMLTPLVEKGRVKCEKYWPEIGKELLLSKGAMVVKTVDESVDQKIPDLVVRKIVVCWSDGVVVKEQEITQFHFVGWADHSVSASDSVLNLIHLTEKLQLEYTARFNDQSIGPMIVHCSAGCGRTGTLITIACIMDIILDDRKRQLGRSRVDLVPRIVGDLRKQRYLMVQTFDQYRFCYEVLDLWVKRLDEKS